MRPGRWAAFLIALIVLFPVRAILAQDPPIAESASPNASSQDLKKHPHANDTLVRGTVFTDKAFSLRGAQLRLRRVGEKKFRWERFSNSQGEFGIFVPKGSKYEMVVHAKGFTDQTQVVDTQAGQEEERMVIHMEPAVGGKK